MQEQTTPNEEVFDEDDIMPNHIVAGLQESDDRDDSEVVFDTSGKILEEHSDRKKASEMKQMLAMVAGLTAGIGMSGGMPFDPTTLIPRKYMRQRKHYDPVYSSEKATEIANHNQEIEQKRLAKKLEKLQRNKESRLK